MNDRAREILATAGLQGHPQIRKTWHTDKGECALGVLHLACHATREEALQCYNARQNNHEYNNFSEIREMFDLSWPELRQIWTANDNGWDFLTIARKIGVPEETNV